MIWTYDIIFDIMLFLQYHRAQERLPPVAERLRRAYPALLERAGVGSISANSDALKVPSFRRRTAVGDLKWSLVPRAQERLRICYIGYHDLYDIIYDIIQWYQFWYDSVCWAALFMLNIFLYPDLYDIIYNFICHSIMTSYMISCVK